METLNSTSVFLLSETQCCQLWAIFINISLDSEKIQTILVYNYIKQHLKQLILEKTEQLTKMKTLSKSNLTSKLHVQSTVPKCGNIRIFLSLRFYVKTIVTILEIAKMVILTIFEVLNFHLVNFWPQKLLKWTKVQNQSLTNWQNGFFGGLLNWQNQLIVQTKWQENS